MNIATSTVHGDTRMVACYDREPMQHLPQQHLSRLAPVEGAN